MNITGDGFHVESSVRVNLALVRIKYDEDLTLEETAATYRIEAVFSVRRTSSDTYCGDGRPMYLQFADGSVAPLFLDQYNNMWFQFDGVMYPHTPENTRAVVEEVSRRVCGLPDYEVLVRHPAGCDSTTKLDE
jgi:hypothetical protein